MSKEFDPFLEIRSSKYKELLLALETLADRSREYINYMDYDGDHVDYLLAEIIEHVDKLLLEL